MSYLDRFFSILFEIIIKSSIELKINFRSHHGTSTQREIYMCE